MRMRRLASFILAGLIAAVATAHQVRADGMEPARPIAHPRKVWREPAGAPVYAARPYRPAPRVHARFGYDAPPPAYAEAPSWVEMRKPYLPDGLVYNLPPEPTWTYVYVYNGRDRDRPHRYGPVIRARY